MSLRVRFGLLNGILAIVFILSSVIAWRTDDRMDHDIHSIQVRMDETTKKSRLMDVVGELKFTIVQIQQSLTNISATQGLNGLDNGETEAAEYGKAFHSQLGAARQLAEELKLPPILKSLAETEAAFTPYYDAGRKMAEAYVSGGPEAGNRFMPSFDSAAKALSRQVGLLADQGAQELEESRKGLGAGLDNIETSGSQVLQNLLISAVICLTINFIVWFTANQKIIRPVIALGQSVNDIAAGKFDGDIPGRDHKDEIGKMARAVAVLKDNALEKQQLEENQKKKDLASAQKEREAKTMLADQFEQQVQSIIRRVVSASDELNHTAESMSRLIAQAAGKAESVSENTGTTAANVQTTAAAIEELSSSSSEIAQRISQSTEAVRETVNEVEKANESSRLLEEANRKIEDIVMLIQDVAGQINLLALNATIESARAGDAGKGFAVVASEVKNLASQTSKATDDIALQIRNMQSVSGNVIHAFRLIKQTISRVDEYSSTIAAAAEEQSATTGEIATSMSAAAAGSGRMSVDIGGVLEASSAASAAAAQVSQSARTLSGEIRELDKEVGHFLKEIRS